jgi:hypothetical protein
VRSATDRRHVSEKDRRPGAAEILQRITERGYGQIVGLAYDPRGGSRGFLLERGTLTMIDATPDAVFTRASDINNRGQIVGDYASGPPAGARSSSVAPADRRAGARLLDRLGPNLRAAAAGLP